MKGSEPGEDLFSDFHIGPEAKKFFEMAYRMQMQGELDSAVYYYKKSLEIQPTAEGYTFLGWTYSVQGKLRQAISACRRAIDADPDFGNPYNDIGAYYLQMGELEKAIPWLKKAKKAKRYASPEFAYMNLGKVYERKGLWPLALIEYRGALKVNPDYDPAREEIARIEPNLN